MFQEILYPLCALLNYAAAVSRIPGLRHRHDLPSRALVGSFLALGTTFALATPVIWVRVDALFGMPNITALLYQSLVIVYTVTIQYMLLYWHSPESAHRKMIWRLLLGAATIGLMAMLFILADTGEQRTTDFMAHYAHMPVMGLYLLIYLITFIIGRIDVARLCFRYAPSASTPWLHRALYWTAAGAISGVLYFVARMADVIAPHLGGDPLRWEPVAALAAVASSILTMIGLTMPSWGPRISKFKQWGRHYTEFQRLHPLWSKLAAEFPKVQLIGIVPRRWAVARRTSDLVLWLSRMKTEIRDAQIELGRARRSREVAEAARSRAESSGITDDAQEAIIQAALIEYGFAEKTRAGTLDGPGLSEPLHGGTNAIDEVQFLLRVSRSRRHPIVRQTVEQFEDELPVRSVTAR